MTSALAAHQAWTAAATSPSSGGRPSCVDQRVRGDVPEAVAADDDALAGGAGAGAVGAGRPSGAGGVGPVGAAPGRPASRGLPSAAAAAAGVGQRQGAAREGRDPESEPEEQRRAAPRAGGERRPEERPGQRRPTMPGRAVAAVRARPSAPQAQTAQASRPGRGGDEGVGPLRCRRFAGQRPARGHDRERGVSAARTTAIALIAAVVSGKRRTDISTSSGGDG